MDRHRFQSVLMQTLDYAKAAGAESADVLAVESDSLSVTLYNGSIEKVNSAHSFDLGLRVFKGKKQALVSTQDVDAQSLKKAAYDAVSMLAYVPDDSNCGLREGLPTHSVDSADLDLYDATEVDIEHLIERAKICEAAASSFDGVVKAEETSSATSKSIYGVASSSGLSHISEQTGQYTSVSVLAKADAERQVHYDYTYQTHVEDLRDPKEMGSEAADFAKRKLKARKIASQKVPIIFDPRIGSRLIGYLMDALNGKAVSLEGRSFLQGKMGQLIAHSSLTLVDDPFMPRGRGSVSIDHEFTTPKKRNLIEQGVLKSWILDLRTARKMGLESTGHGFRSPRSIPVPSATNVYLKPGNINRQDMIQSVKKGLYVFDLMGHGYNSTTGDLSEGAMGFWIEEGEICYPVHEVTIAGNLSDLIQNVLIADDLSFKYSLNTPTMLVEGMTIAGM